MQLFITSIISLIIGVFIGYRWYKSRWNVKENNDKIINYGIINDKVTHINNVNQDVIVKNQQWYLSQMNNVAIYLSNEYNDNTLIDNIQIGKSLPIQKIRYNLDVLLDKISISGYESLNEDEINFLNDN